MRGKIAFIFSLLCVVTLAGFIAPATAQNPYRVTDSQVQQVLSRLETHADTYRASLNPALDRSRINATNREADINRYVQEFEQATNQLLERFRNRLSVG